MGAYFIQGKWKQKSGIHNIMRKIGTFLQLAWLRLFTGETPLFFIYWGQSLAVLTSISLYLTAKVMIAPDPVKEKYQVSIWVFDLIIGLLHVITPFMTTKNQGVAQDNFKQAVQEGKLAKHSK